MKIEIQPGVILQIDANRTATTRGGVIDVEVSPEDRARILATPGVRLLDEVPEPAAEAAEESK
ncbi:MAG: hypothetical protein OEW52_00065 [Thermoleophilia bacterium]|nr:hypothetical protein [Thermoleophilia bacterium]